MCARAWIWKYNSGVTPDQSPISSRPYMVAKRGPNLACPDPIVPLTGNRGTLINAAESFMSYGLSGHQYRHRPRLGLAHAVPGFRAGGAALCARGHRKIVILMTDALQRFRSAEQKKKKKKKTTGTARITRVPDMSRARRFGTRNRNQIMNTLDQRTAEVCERIRGAR